MADNDTSHVPSVEFSHQIGQNQKEADPSMTLMRAKAGSAGGESAAADEW